MWTWDSGASAAGCWMAGSGPAGWQTFPKGFSGLFCSSLNFCHLLLFVLWLKVLVFESRVHVVSVKAEQGNRPHFHMFFCLMLPYFKAGFIYLKKDLLILLCQSTVLSLTIYTRCWVRALISNLTIQNFPEVQVRFINGLDKAFSVQNLLTSTCDLIICSKISFWYPEWESFEFKLW